MTLTTEILTNELGESYHYCLDFKGKPFAIDKTLATNLLMKLKYIRQYEGDMVIFVDGFEGTGKSTMARQLAKLLDPRFDHTHITYDINDCIRLYNSLPELSAIVQDESDEGVTRKDTMSKGNKNYASFMRQSRQARKLLILCGPSIYDIDSYIAEHRVTFLIRCYLKDGLKPGFFKFYNKKDIHALFTYEKKTRTYNRQPRFIGRFSKAETCDMEIYKLKKRAAFDKFFNGLSSEPAVSREQAELEYKKKRALAYSDVIRRRKVTIAAYCDALGISRSSFKNWHEQEGIDIRGLKDKDFGDEPEPELPEYIKEDMPKPKAIDKSVKQLIIPGIQRQIESVEPRPLILYKPL